MPFIPAVNTAQLRFLQRLHGQLVTNTVYLTKNSQWGVDDLQTAGNAAMTWWNDQMADNLSTDYVLEGVQLRAMHAEDAPGIELQAPPASGGNVASGALPGNVSLAVKFITGLTGRNRRGRVFMAGLPESAVTGNDVLALVRDGIVDAWGEFRIAMQALGYNHAVASFYDGTELVEQPNGETTFEPVPRATALLTEVVQYRADNQVDSQRRRLSGRGV